MGRSLRLALSAMVALSIVVGGSSAYADPLPPSVEPGPGAQHAVALAPKGTAKGQAAANWARTTVGAAYVWGGNGPGFDCSGLTSRAWASVGVKITRTSRSQYQRTAKVAYTSMQPGDLIFYARDINNPATIYHVAMFLGDGMMIEAPKPGATVRIVPVVRKNSMPYAGRP